MAIIVLMIAISLTIAIVFLVVFFWNMKSGQYDDTYTPSVRMLFDAKPTKAKGKSSSIYLISGKKTDKSQSLD